MSTLLEFVKSYNVIPKKICNNLLKIFKKVDYHYHSWQLYGEDKGSRKEQELKNYNLTKKEQDILVPFVLDAISKYQNDIYSNYSVLNFSGASPSLVCNLSPFRLNKYDKNTNMACHIDSIHSLFDGNEKGIPVLSIVGVLNDNYKAGEFKILDKEIILKQGDILVFPSNFMFPHQVKTIEKGTRYSFVTWAY